MKLSKTEPIWSYRKCRRFSDPAQIYERHDRRVLICSLHDVSTGELEDGGCIPALRARRNFHRHAHLWEIVFDEPCHEETLHWRPQRAAEVQGAGRRAWRLQFRLVGQLQCSSTTAKNAMTPGNRCQWLILPSFDSPRSRADSDRSTKWQHHFFYCPVDQIIGFHEHT